MSSGVRRSKKKNVESSTQTAVTNGPSSLPPDSVLPPLNSSDVPKKGRKKQFSVVASVGPNGIQGNLLPEIRKPLIAHLPIQSKDIQMGCLTNNMACFPVTIKIAYAVGAPEFLSIWIPPISSKLV